MQSFSAGFGAALAPIKSDARKARKIFAKGNNQGLGDCCPALPQKHSRMAAMKLIWLTCAKVVITFWVIF
jgi:hypothetical protein